MAFSTRRGRPPRPYSDGPDLGTPELCFKRAYNLTQEPIDQVLNRGLITLKQHWCGLHLRWLYTLRYGAPSITTRYTDSTDTSISNELDPQWRMMREREYSDAASALKAANRYEPVMRLCVFNELPAFLNDALRRRAWTDSALAAQLNRHHQLLLEGLTLLESRWRTVTPPTKQNNDIQ